MIHRGLQYMQHPKKSKTQLTTNEQKPIELNYLIGQHKENRKTATTKTSKKRNRESLDLAVRRLFLNKRYLGTVVGGKPK